MSSAGVNKINAIKVVRELSPDKIGLKEAKDLVETAPRLVGTGLDRSTAEEFVRRLREVGATAELQ